MNLFSWIHLIFVLSLGFILTVLLVDLVYTAVVKAMGKQRYSLFERVFIIKNTKPSSFLYLLSFLNPFILLKSFRPVSPDIKALNRAKLAYQKVLTLSAGDFKPTNLNLISKNFADCFVLEPVSFSTKLIEAVQEHNQDVLTSILAFAERNSLIAKNVVNIETLFEDRTSYLLSRFEACSTMKTLRKREQEKGKKNPEWALKEYAEKVLALEDQLRTNKQSLSKQISEMLAGLKNEDRTSSSVTYH